MTKYFSDTCNILTNIREVREEPFPFASTLFCLPETLYAELARTRPEVRGNGNNKRFNLGAKELLERRDLPEIWRDFIEYHTSFNFACRIWNRFDVGFKKHYPELPPMFKVGIRDIDKDCDIYLDVQLAINSPVTERSTVGGPHLDHPEELWAALLYMPLPGDTAGGDLVIYKCNGEPIIEGKRQVKSNNLKEVGRVPYMQNTMGCFMNSRRSIHGVSERDVTDKQRMFVNISLEMPKGKELFNAS